METEPKIYKTAIKPIKTKASASKTKTVGTSGSENK